VNGVPVDFAMTFATFVSLMKRSFPGNGRSAAREAMLEPSSGESREESEPESGARHEDPPSRSLTVVGVFGQSVFLVISDAWRRETAS
jgi:hypothetical protein